MSFDEATFVGLDRYLTVNVHHCEAIFGDSRVAPLSLIRVEGKATSEYLKTAISHRLRDVNLENEDFLAAAADGAANVVKAVQKMGLWKQKCFAHGINLVVNKVIYGKEALAFNVSILVARYAGDEDTENDEIEEIEQTGKEEDCRAIKICVREAVARVRSVCRFFKKRPVAMDEIRQMTAKDEFNGKRLGPILDTKTRWYSTLNMIERALEI